ncbi:MAG TPA: VOC family protein [Phenylobacterium sp.]
MSDTAAVADPRAKTDVRPAFTPTLFYRDPKAALDWLEKAFGFEISTLLTDKDGNIAHAEMSFGDSRLGVAGEWSGIGKPWAPAQMLSPQTIGSVGTQFLWVELDSDIDVHCERAKTAGARIIEELTDQFYGARTYRALDLDGHVWNFRQDKAQPTVAEMEAATGLRFVKGG